MTILSPFQPVFQPAFQQWLAVPALLVAFALAQETDEKPKGPDPFVDRVVEYKIGDGGGSGEKELPKIVLGPPKGEGKFRSGTDVFSLGHGGTIVLEFVDNEVVDGEGPDLIVFENPFLAEPGNNPDIGHFELAKVEVSVDGVTWKEFPFDTGTRKGCAGWHPVFSHPDKPEISPTDPKAAGGDAFDLKDVGLKMIRFVRITDLKNTSGGAGATGFDLDAIAAVNSRPRP